MKLVDTAEELQRIIASKNVAALFQPIVQLNEQRILGYEALIRGPSDSPLHSPAMLFDAAARCGQLDELDYLCREACLCRFGKQSLRGKIFINVNPDSLLGSLHVWNKTHALLEQAGLAPDRIVIELTEQQPFQDYNVLREAIIDYQQKGFQIAIDDLGAGYAGLRVWSELRPDYVKIDRHFIEAIHEDAVKQEFVHSILDIARGLNCRVIAEGIETHAEYQTVRRLGITLGQGYFFARPQPVPVRKLSHQLFHYDPAGQAFRPMRLSDTVGSLSTPVQALEATASLEEAAEQFRSQPDISCLPIVENGVPTGLLTHDLIMEHLTHRFGYDLNARKPVARFMDEQPIIVEHTDKLESVSHKVTHHAQSGNLLDFIITHKGRYMGMGRVVDLLKRITEQQIRTARYANPLTLLPGNVPIYELIDQLLADGESFHVAYCGLDNFKPYNDVYGYAKGDEIIRLVADRLVSHTRSEFDFVGHIGGDDFIIVFRDGQWKESCRQILDSFAAHVASLYRPDDRQQGGIWTADRTGKRLFHPLLSLSIGIVSPDPQRCHSHHEVAELASMAKRQAKKDKGNSLFICKRRGPDRSATPRNSRTGKLAS